MKVGELRGAIRKMKGNPSIRVSVGSVVLTLPLQKTPLLAELEAQFPGGKAVETPLEFDEARGIILTPNDGLMPPAPADDLDTEVLTDDEMFDFDEPTSGSANEHFRSTGADVILDLDEPSTSAPASDDDDDGLLV